MNFSYLRREPGFYRRVFTLALPVVLQNLITTSLGFMDTFMVGLVGQEQMSAVTVANVPIYIIQLIVFGLQSGSRVLISQFWGRGDRESINRVMGIGFFVAGGISTLCALTMGLFPRQVLMLITDNARLVELGTSYIRIVGFSYILNSLSSIYIGMQQSIENPRFGMTVFAISTVCNTVGNYILIFGKLGLPALGITGAAIATFSSRVVEFVISLVYALRCKQMPLMPACILRPGKATFRSFVKFSTPVLLNETLWGTGTSLYTVIMGHMAGSTDLISAYTVAGNIDKMVTVAIFGVAAAAAVIVGKEVGMGGQKRLSHWSGPDLCGLLHRLWCRNSGAAAVLARAEAPRAASVLHDRRLSVSLRDHDDLLLHLCPAPRLCHHRHRGRSPGRRRCADRHADRRSPPVVLHPAAAGAAGAGTPRSHRHLLLHHGHGIRFEGSLRPAPDPQRQVDP